MANVQHYFPNDLNYKTLGFLMEREKFDAMVAEIFDKGVVVDVCVHGYSQLMPGEEQKFYSVFSKAVVVEITYPVCIKYTVHFRGFSPIEIIEDL